MKITEELARNERMHYFEKKKPPKLYKSQHFFGFQLARGAPVCRAGGKTSTWLPRGTRRADHIIHNNFLIYPPSGFLQSLFPDSEAFLGKNPSKFEFVHHFLRFW